MTNKRFPKAGDKVKIVNWRRAEKYKDKVMVVKKSAFVFDRNIVAEIEGIKAYIPIKNLQILKA